MTHGPDEAVSLLWFNDGVEVRSIIAASMVLIVREFSGSCH